MPQPQRPDHAPADAAVPAKPAAPPTGALPVVPAPNHPPTSALPVLPPSAAPVPDAAGSPAAAPAPSGQGPSAPSTAPSSATVPAATSSAATSSAGTAPTESEPSRELAVQIRTAVLAVPGVAAVGEPVARVIGRIARAIGQDTGSGVAVSGGDTGTTVDLGFVACPTRPLRATAEAVQRAVANVVTEHGRRPDSVDIDVLDVAAPQHETAPQQHADGGAGASPAVGEAAAGADHAASGTSSRVAGHVRISSRALSSTARHLAAATFSTPEKRIAVTLQDDAGDLALRLNLPLPVAGLRSTAATDAQSVRIRAIGLRGALRERFETITGATLSRVDVVVTGMIDAEGGAA